VVGGRAFTSIILQRNCHEFIAYENLIRKPSVRGRPSAPSAAAQPIAQAFPIVRRALKILADREVSPQTGLLKSTLLQLDSTFSERNYGASSFLDFAQKISEAGLVQLKHAGRSVMVELNEGFDEGEPPAAQSDGSVSTAPPIAPATPSSVPPAAPLPQAGEPAEAVRLTANALRAAANARWPMYLRNVKQILRAANIDERRYGMMGLMDLIRACQREGLLRTERDRRGGLRVFQGAALMANIAVPVQAAAAFAGAIDDDNESQPAALGGVHEPSFNVGSDADDEPIEVAPATIVDTTAELLGRSTSKRTRAKQPARPAAQRRTAAKKPAATRRSSRTRRTPSDAGDEPGNA
jgi:hypothetical protein